MHGIGLTPMETVLDRGSFMTNHFPARLLLCLSTRGDPMPSSPPSRCSSIASSKAMLPGLEPCIRMQLGSCPPRHPRMPWPLVVFRLRNTSTKRGRRSRPGSVNPHSRASLTLSITFTALLVCYNLRLWDDSIASARPSHSRASSPSCSFWKDATLHHLPPASTFQSPTAPIRFCPVSDSASLSGEILSSPA